MEKRKKFVITIGREFGAEGHEIGKELAERLGINMYDKDLLSMAAEKSGIDRDTLASTEERVVNRFLEPYVPLGFNGETVADRVFKIQSQIIRELADHESCVIIGRLADYILRDEKNCIRVFIFAPLEDRMKRIAKKHSISEEAAKKLIKRMDTARKNYYSYYSNGKAKWSSKDGKDILLNRECYDVDGCVDILEMMIKKQFY